jgi:hypothetical protein
MKRKPWFTGTSIVTVVAHPNPAESDLMTRSKKDPGLRGAQFLGNSPLKTEWGQPEG